MLRKVVLASLFAIVAVPAPTASARAAEESSSPSEDAPFAGTGHKSAPAPFAASPSAGFGAIAQWVISMRTTADGGYVFFHKSSPGDYEIALHPAVDYFITNSVSLGATFGYRHTPAETGTTNVDLGARAGFNLTINDNIGFWPSAGVGVNIFSSDHNTNTSAAFGLFAPFLYHLVPHLFAGIGPSFSLQLNDGNGKSYGIDFVLGGWL